MQPNSEERIRSGAARAAEARIVRRRGAQPGNVNALKHGRYARAAIAERRRLRELLRSARDARRILESGLMR